MNKYQARQLPLTVAAGSTLAMGSLQAATITVNSALDAPVGTYQYLCTLRAAITAANTDAEVDGCVAGNGLDEIEFLPGLASSTITLGSTLVVRRSMSLSGPVDDDPAGLTISGNDAHQVIRINQQGRGGPIDVSLENLTIEGGSLTNDPDRRGGGIGSIGSDLSLRHVTVVDSYSQYGGGGVAWYNGNYGVQNSLTLQDVLISRNSTGPYNQGGGLFAEQADLAVTDSEISQNSSGYRGGGLYVTSSNAIINGTEIAGNSTVSPYIALGAGIFLSDSSLSATGTTITNNDIPNGDGGTGAGVHSVGSSLAFFDSEVTSNRLTAAEGTNATTSGAGLYLSGGDLFLDRTVVSGNVLDSSSSAGSGYGAGLWASNVGLTISYSAFSDNELTIGAFGQAGGAYFNNSAGSIAYSEISDNLVSGASANAGAALVSGGVINIRNTTISGNRLDTGEAGDGNATAGLVMFGSDSDSVEILHSTIANNFNLGTRPVLSVRRNGQLTWTMNQTIVSSPIGSPACNGLPDSAVETLATDTTCTGAVTTPEALALQPLADNGGPTRTHALAPSSSAIDLSGDCATTLLISKDQRGRGRDAECDIGAFEYISDGIFNDRFEVQPR